MGKADVELFGDGINLRKEAFEAFEKMKKAAYADGFDIKMVSSFTGISIGKKPFGNESTCALPKMMVWNLWKPLTRSLNTPQFPGTSRHHWGTDIDIIDGYPKTSGDVLVPEKFEAGGPFADFKVVAR